MEEENLIHEEIVTDDTDLDEDFERELDQELEKLSNNSEQQANNDVEQETTSQTAKDESDNDSAAEVGSRQSTPTEGATTEDTHNTLLEGFRNPIRGKWESEEAYEARKLLAELASKRKSARSPEEIQNLTAEIDKTRQALRTSSHQDGINRSQSFNNDNASSHVTPEYGEQESDSLQRRPATIEEVQAMLDQREKAKDVTTTLQSFIGRHPELSDVDTREVFFDFVESNYNWQDKTGKDLMTVLELARENMFKPSETIQERVLKSAGVQQKVNAMQFPGGSVVKPGYTPEQQKSINELTAMGYSEKDALDMISD